MKILGFEGINPKGIYGRSWKCFLRDLLTQFNKADLFARSASMAYYFMFAIFPGMIFLLSLLPLLPISHLQEQIAPSLDEFLPDTAAQLFNSTIDQVMSGKKLTLLSIGAVLALWAATSGMSCLIDEFNSAFGTHNRRSYLKTTMISLLLTLEFGGLIIIAFLLIVFAETIATFARLHFGQGVLQSWLWIFNVLRWALIIVLFQFALSEIRYFGAQLKQEFIFITPGGTLSILLFILSSLGFKLYVDNFGNYNAIYGGLGAAIVLMAWFNILGIAILMGAQLDSLIHFYQEDNHA